MSTAGTQRVEADAAHHPAVLAFKRIHAVQSPGFELDFLGTRTRRTYVGAADVPQADAAEERVVQPAYPAFDEEYFEWLDVLETVQAAAKTYVFVELGAGFGRWSMRAASAVRRKGDCTFRCVAVEAEPNHFRFLLQHFRDNGVNPDDHELVWGAVSKDPGFVPFAVGNARECYGQRMAAITDAAFPDIRTRKRLKARSVLARPPVLTAPERAVIWVPAVTLSDVLASYPRVDLIDVDVQRAELQILKPAIDLLTERVRRIHIGTHEPRLEAGLRNLFGSAGWVSQYDFPCHQSSVTPYGRIAFADGVQTWVNPFVESNTPRPVPRRTAQQLRRRLRELKSRHRDLKEERSTLKTRIRALEHQVHLLDGRWRSVWRRWSDRFRGRRSGQ